MPDIVFAGSNGLVQGERQQLTETIESVSPTYEEWILATYRFTGGQVICIALAVNRNWTATAHTGAALAECIECEFPRQ